MLSGRSFTAIRHFGTSQARRYNGIIPRSLDDLKARLGIPGKNNSNLLNTANDYLHHIPPPMHVITICLIVVVIRILYIYAYFFSIGLGNSGTDGVSLFFSFCSLEVDSVLLSSLWGISLRRLNAGVSKVKVTLHTVAKLLFIKSSDELTSYTPLTWSYIIVVICQIILGCFLKHKWSKN